MVMRCAREWRTALVSASCAIADDLALDAVAEPRQLVDDDVDRHAGRPLTQLGQPLERRRDVFAAADVGTKRANRPARLRQMRARQIDRGLDARRHRRRQRRRLRAGAPAAASGSRRIPARGCRECPARGDCAPRGSPCGAPRADCARRAGCGAAPAPPDGRPPRSARRATTGSRAPSARRLHDRHPPERAAAQDQRRRDDRVRILLAAELSNRLRQSGVVALVLDGLAPPGV